MPARQLDLYRWAYKLLPVVSSELVVDCFELSREIWNLDMRASPYELREWGYEPVRIEIIEGKAAYMQYQRDFAERGAVLRAVAGDDRGPEGLRQCPRAEAHVTTDTKDPEEENDPLGYIGRVVAGVNNSEFSGVHVESGQD